MSYCLIESQDWVGSDVIRPDCTTDASDPSCADPTDVSPDNERLANLYGNDVVWPHDRARSISMLMMTSALQRVLYTADVPATYVPISSRS